MFEGRYDIGLTDIPVGLTGSLFGLDDESVSSLMKSVGTTYCASFGKKTCRALIVGDVEKYGGETNSMEKAARWGYPLIDGDELRQRYLETTGIDIGTC